MRTLIDLMGCVFGRLRVVGSFRKQSPSGVDEVFWVCRCSCGNTANVPVRGWCLRKGITSSCGCLRAEKLRNPRKSDLTGMIFERLTVICPVRVRVGRKDVINWKCVCSCKTETIVQRSKLLRGETRSCGCLRREMVFLPRDVAGFHAVLAERKKSARDRGIEWGLSDDAARLLFAQECHYCGELPKSISTVRGTKAPVNYAYNGVDRKDNSVGYTSDNVLPCCTQCNYMKRDYSYTDFVEKCRRVAAKHPAQPFADVMPNRAIILPTK